jgi:hypothetical protein
VRNIINNADFFDQELKKKKIKIKNKEEKNRNLNKK